MVDRREIAAIENGPRVYINQAEAARVFGGP
jgi:hypothetical protein